MEQISEELKTLDEILTGDEGTDGRADEQTDEESATPTEVTDVLGSDTEGSMPICFIKVLNFSGV